MKLTEKTRRSGELLFFLGVFLSLCFFYTAAHPLVLIDLDDWAYFSYSRLALPFPNFWNPSRVLPEVLMPACGTAAALLSSLLLHDYVKAQVLVVAWVLSFFITVYVWAFCRLLRRRFSLGCGVSLLLGLVFLLLHFLIFRTADSGNVHLFYTVDVVCLYFYTIPALLCASLVMLSLADNLLDAAPAALSPLRQGFRLLVLYLALFSNLFGSVILAVYAGCELLGRLFTCIRERQNFGAFLKAQYRRLAVVLVWLLAVLLEALGGRAGVSLTNRAPLGLRVRAALGYLGQVLHGLNLLFLALVLAAALFALLLLLLHRRTADGFSPLPGLLGLSLACGALCTVFLVLLCAVVDPEYLSQPSANFAIFFYLILLSGLCAGYAFSRWKKLALLLPLAVLVLLSAVNTNTKTFADQNCIGVSGQTCMAINRDLIGQITRAEAAGEKEVTVYTMDTDNDYDNWPHSTLHLVDTLARALWKHGVIRDPIHITLEPSEAFNETYGLRFPPSSY